MVDIKEIIAKSLEEIRKSRGLTHSAFAEKLGINRTTLYLYESGRRILPCELVYRLWEVLEVEPNELFRIVKD